MNRINCLCIVFLWYSYQALAQSPQIIYVNKGATGTASGISWTNAYTEVRIALTAAGSISGPKEIWVAQGEYKPTDDLNREASFVIPANTFLCGGFVGNETSKDARNWRTNRTVLSGDLGRQFDKSDNSYHVVTAMDIDQNSGLDGLIIKEGNADGTASLSNFGGGILILSTVSPTSPKIDNCILVENHAQTGGGIATFGPNQPVMPEISNTTFNGNSAVLLGGGLWVGNTPDFNYTTCTNCSFSSNVSAFGGAFGNHGPARLVNCTMTYNKSEAGGSALFGNFPFSLTNSVVWKNFAGSIENPNYANQIIDVSENSGSIITDNIIDGGYGSETANNLNSDPLFEREPSFTGKFPRTSIIPVAGTDMKYENRLEFNGPVMWGAWPYYAYKDHAYNKIYMPGSSLQVLDFSNLTNNKPNSTIYTTLAWPRTQRLEKSIYSEGNKLYIASYNSGMHSVDRQTGELQRHNLLTGEPVPDQTHGPNDLVVDDVNNLLYGPVFYGPNQVFYGMLELNLVTQAKRWITPTSTPVNTIPVTNKDDNGYWGGHRILLDEPESILYFSTGNGVWWWNRDTNTTGVISMQGGIPLVAGSPGLPTNLTTGMFMDHVENKFYIGTHAGLFVWDRTNNTSRVYNTQNSSLMHNVINHIDKNEGKHLIYVACEDGGLFIINTLTGEEKLIHEDAGNEVYPQFMDNAAGSAYYDEYDNKLYVCADHWSGGVWIQDYNNLIPDYGDLRLKAGSPAIDRGNVSYLPAGLTLDIEGLSRFVDFASLFGQNSLDLGAYEKIFQDEEAPPAPVIPDNSGMNYVLTYSTVKEGIKDETTLDNFPVKDVNRSIQYIDGIGRPVQTIDIQGSASRFDVVQPIVYDKFGRQANKYLPFVYGNDGTYNQNPVGTNSPQQQFYGGNNESIAEDEVPFSTTKFESSTLNRPLKDYGVGDAWSAATNDKPIVHGYLSNAHDLTNSTSAEAIFAFKVNALGALELESPASGYIEPEGYFSSNQLFIKTTKDENGHEVREYANKLGQLILKKVQAVANSTNLNDPEQWACTYYVYDDLGNLSFVLQPEGVKNLLPLLNQN